MDKTYPSANRPNLPVSFFEPRLTSVSILLLGLLILKPIAFVLWKRQPVLRWRWRAELGSKSVAEFYYDTSAHRYSTEASKTAVLVVQDSMSGLGISFDRVCVTMFCCISRYSTLKEWVLSWIWLISWFAANWKAYKSCRTKEGVQAGGTHDMKPANNG